MLNRYPLWKYLLIVAVLALGLIYAMPNLYPDDPAIQISGASSTLEIQQPDLDRIEQALAAANLPTKGTELGANGRSGLVRLVNRADQLKAQDVVRDALCCVANVAFTSSHARQLMCELCASSIL